MEPLDLIRPNPLPEAYSFTPIRNSPPRTEGAAEEDGESEEEASRKRPRVVQQSPQRNRRRWSLCGVLGIVILVLFVVGAIWFYFARIQDPPSLRIWRSTHVTLSLPVKVPGPYAEELVWQLQSSMRTHLDYYPCVCMHHLTGVVFPPYQVCSVASATGAPPLMMVNPRLKGRGNETDTYWERSVACEGPGVRRERYRTVLVEWWDVRGGGQDMFARFDGETAWCLQRALDEMTLGDKMCVP